MKSTDHEITSPPYCSWKAFETFVAELKGKNSVPSHVDRSTLPRMSGGMETQLLATLRYLNCIDDNGKTTGLRSIVEAHGTEHWQEAVKEMVSHCYQTLLQGIDLENITPGKLKEMLSERTGTRASTTDRVMRFLLNAHKIAGIPYSSHLMIRKASSRRRTAGHQKQREEGENGFDACTNDNQTPNDPAIEYGFRHDIQIRLTIQQLLRMDDGRRQNLFNSIKVIDEILNEARGEKATQNQFGTGKNNDTESDVSVPPSEPVVMKL